MNEQIERALSHDRTIDITTTGRKSGLPRRTEIWFHHVEGRIYITGLPGTRDWYANLAAKPDFTFHFKESVQADLPARARPILDKTERRAVFLKIFQKLGGERDLEAWLAGSPLVEVEVPAG